MDTLIIITSSQQEACVAGRSVTLVVINLAMAWSAFSFVVALEKRSISFRLFFIKKPFDLSTQRG